MNLDALPTPPSQPLPPAFSLPTLGVVFVAASASNISLSGEKSVSTSQVASRVPVPKEKTSLVCNLFERDGDMI